MSATLSIPPALYDYVLYYECAKKDWIDYNKKTSIKGDGSLTNYINWNSTYSYDPDDKGGKTLFGVTELSWQTFVEKYPNKGYSKDLNSMGKKGWYDQINWYWSEKSSAGKCANYGCAFLIFQMVWGGFGVSNQNVLLDTLKANADIKDYNFITSGNNYRKIADATNAYTDSMIPYDYMRKAIAAYYYNISSPSNSNKKFRMGWLNRTALAFTPYGLYVPTKVDGTTAGLSYTSSLSDWETTAIQLAINNTKGYVKIMDWGSEPESIEKITNSSYDFEAAANTYVVKSSNNTNNSNVYSGYGSVSQLGNYIKMAETQKSQDTHHQTKNRENILNELINGSYIPKTIKKCLELTSSDKKKGIKTKSEQ